MRRKIKNHISKRISHSRKKRLCESIFAYCVNRPSTYLCTLVGAVSLSACVSQRLQRVEKYFFDTLSGADFHLLRFSFIVYLLCSLARILAKSDFLGSLYSFCACSAS